MRRGEPTKALSVLRDVITKHPQLLEAQVLYQDVMRSAGNRPSLIETYKARLQDHPKDTNAQYLYARLLVGSKAVAELRKLTRNAPEFARGWAAYARALRRRGKLEKAEKAARKAVALDASLADAHDVLGWILDHRGEWKEAEEFYRQALGLRPLGLRTRYKLAHLLVRLDRGRAAIAEIDRAVKSAPRNPQALINRGLVHSALGDAASAIESYRAAIEQAPRDAIVLVLLAESYADVAEWGLARRAVVQAKEINPKYAPAHAAAGYVHLRRGDAKAAVGDYLKAASLDSKNASYPFYAALAYDKFADNKNAVRYHKLAIARDRDNPRYRLALGGLLEKLGKTREAMAVYRAATRVAPEDPDGWTRLGHVAADARRHRAAVRAFKRAHALKPDDLEVILSLGIVYETGLRDEKAAADYYRLYIGKGGTDPDVADWLKRIDDAR